MFLASWCAAFGLDERKIDGGKKKCFYVVVAEI